MTIDTTTATNSDLTPTVPGTYWQWRGESVYYLRAGSSDRPPLLLVHGFGASTDHWRKNVAELQQDFEVWAIDLLGFGRSSKPAWTYSGQLWQEQLQEFIAAVVRRPVAIAGNSLGGYAALCVAANHPEWIEGVILLNSAGPFTDNAETAAKPTNPLQSLTSRALRGLFLQPWASNLLFQWLRQPWVIRRTLEKVYVDRTAITEQLVEDIYWPSCDVGAAQVFASVFKSPQGSKVDELLVRLQCPLLLLWGEGDPWMQARERSQKFRQYYPQLQEVFLQAGHCPHDEVPTQVNAQIRTWMLALTSDIPR
ncbi:MAG: alpha/beta fold hydrolase [Cyanobacteria bacterium J06641_5]